MACPWYRRPGRDAGSPPAACVKFFYGPMDCGKSTLALQIDHNHARQGRHGLLLTRLRPLGRLAQISSRIGLARAAVEVDDEHATWPSWCAGPGPPATGSTT